jgi:hypothetical protein
VEFGCGNIEMGKWVSETLLQLEPLDAEPYIGEKLHIKFDFEF